MLRRLQSFWVNPGFILAVYILVAVVASIQSVLIGTHVKDGHVFTDYNNYIIFRNSFSHLLHGKNLYVLYLDEQADLYKYSPTFALLMAPFPFLPDVVGLALWNLLNALVLLFSLRLLPFTPRQVAQLSWFVLLELLTSMQNAQSNGLMAGLMIASIALMERKKILPAVILLMLSVMVKIYGAIGFLLFLFYPGKWKQAFYIVLVGIVIFALPLVVVSPANLIWQYQNWKIMLAADKAASYGMSVMGWLHSWFGLSSGKDWVSIIGFVLLLLPLIRIKSYSDEGFRWLYLADILLWVIIFNYKAESPTFIIAVAGVGIRHYILPASLWNKTLMWLVFIFTCMSPTDIFPPWVRSHLLIPYTVKALPCILAWAVITWDLLRYRPGSFKSQNTVVAPSGS
jgi:hypothetical protein